MVGILAKKWRKIGVSLEIVLWETLNRRAKSDCDALPSARAICASRILMRSELGRSPRMDAVRLRRPGRPAVQPAISMKSRSFG